MKGRLIRVTVGIALFYWIIDAAIDSFLFHKDTFRSSLLTPDPTEMFMRILTICSIATLGIFAQAAVAKRRKAEEALLESEEKFKNIFDSSKDGIYRTDTDGAFTLINEAGAEIFGHKRPEEVIGRKALDYWYDADLRQIFIDELKNKKYVRLYPMKARKINGDVAYLESSSRIIEDANGNFLGIEGILRDVTERKKAEEEMRRAYEMTRHILDKAPLGIYLVDSRGKIDYVNPAMLNINNDTYETFMSVNVFELPTYVEADISEKIRGVLSGQPFFFGPLEYTSYYGKKTTVRNFIGIPYEEAGEKKALVFVEDITVQKKSEEKLKLILDEVTKAKIEWEMTFDSVAEIIVLVDKDFSIIRCNKSCADFCGVPLNKIPGYKFFDLFPWSPDDMEYFRDKVRNEEPTEWIEIKTTSGRWFYAGSRPIIDKNGAFLYSVIIAADITELKSAHEMLIESQEELKKRVKDLEKFYEMAVGRELKMKELKKEIKRLTDELELKNRR